MHSSTSSSSLVYQDWSESVLSFHLNATTRLTLEFGCHVGDLYYSISHSSRTSASYIKLITY